MLVYLCLVPPTPTLFLCLNFDRRLGPDSERGPRLGSSAAAEISDVASTSLMKSSWTPAIFGAPDEHITQPSHGEASRIKGPSSHFVSSVDRSVDAVWPVLSVPSLSRNVCVFDASTADVRSLVQLNDLEI